MDKTAPSRWMARHPGVCAVIMAIAIGSGPAVQLVVGPSVALAVLTLVAVVAGAGAGLMLAFMAGWKPRKP